MVAQAQAIAVGGEFWDMVLGRAQKAERHRHSA